MGLSFDAVMKECPVIAILRGLKPEEVADVFEALYAGGIRLLEIPLNTPNALKSVAIAAELGKGRWITGAGTVLTPEEVVAVRAAGGEFVVSPNTEPEVIKETKRLGMISVPGFFTASEAFTAIKAGADYLKLFPAILGPGYVKDLVAVVKKPILAVGGVDATSIPGFMKLCAGVGIGGALYKPGRAIEDIAAAAKTIAAVASKRD